MFLALLYSLIIHQTVTSANPYHKYPYVFLLDIGNEELQTKSEQIRVSIPGGSLALKYPAIGEGDSIAHVRVSGIDFDNDLKASIIEGGPGYKYVVIVFMGNPGRAYDAVVTVSTLDDGKGIDTVYTDQTGTNEVKSSYKVTEDSAEDSNDSAEDSNDSAEDSNDSAEDSYDSAEDSSDSADYSNDGAEDSNDSAEIVENKNYEYNEQLTAASNFYDSAENVDINGKEDESQEDIKVKYRGEAVKIEEQTNDSDSADVQDYADANDQKENNDYDDANAPRAEKYSVHEEYDTHDNGDNSQATKELDRNLYDKYNALRPHLYDYAKVPQEANNAENEVYYNDGVVYSPEDPVELDQMFNDEEVHNDGEKYSDPNYNYADAESSAVAY